MTQFAEVAVDAPLRAGDRVFTFAVPPALVSNVEVGLPVRVPFGRRVVTGFVVGLASATTRTVKTVVGIDERIPSLPADLVSLAWWMADYYVCSLGEALQVMLPALSQARSSRRRSADEVRPLEKFPWSRGSQAGRAAIAPHLTVRSPARIAVIGDDARFDAYEAAVEWATRHNVGVIILAPEISQAEHLAAWMRRRIAHPVALIHGGLSGQARWEAWRRIHSGEIPVVVGTRVAVFSPVRDLGLIVVDREEDTSYKEERAPRYHARRVAEERAHLVGATIVWGSAAPSLEMVQAIEEAQAVRVAVGRITRSRVTLVDVRGVGMRRDLFSRPLRQALARTLPRGRAIIFVPRRGYGDFLLCHECGTVPRCSRCDVAMTYHVRTTGLRCHLCGRTDRAPDVCPICGGTHLRPHGVGTERVEGAARRLFRGTPVMRLDSDIAPDEQAQQRIWTEFAATGGLLIGTQLLVKGIGQVPAAVVGVIGVDAALHLPYFRASERVHQALTQLAALAQQEMIIQTFAPSHPVLRAVQRQETGPFYRRELAARRRFGYPPFRTLVNLLVTGTEASAVRDAAHDLATALQEHGDVLGPSPAPRARIRGQFRWQVLVKERQDASIRSRLRDLLTKAAFPRGVRVTVDVDPVDLL